MFSQIHVVVTAGNCGLMHGLHHTHYMNFLYTLTAALRHGTHLANAYFSTQKAQPCNSTYAWDQKCTVNH